MRGVKNNEPGKAGKPAGSRDLGKNNAWDIDTASGLRDRAEEKIRAVEAGGATALQPGGKNQDLKNVIYELEVHQIELEMQNEELQNAQIKLLESQRRYFELFNFAPVGYFLIDQKGLIKEANLTGASMLGVERGILINKPFIIHIVKDDGDLFYRHLRKVFKSGEEQSCELRLAKKDGQVLFARINSSFLESPEEGSVMRTTLTDITSEKLVEEKLEKSSHNLGLRVTELECLYGIYRVAGKTGASIEEIVQGIVDLVPPGFQYPEIACARIILNSKEFRTKKFIKTDKNLTAGISLMGKLDGLLEVCYREEKPERDEELFSKEEKKLISAVAEQVSIVANRKHLEEQVEIRERMDWLATLAGGIAHDFNNLLAGIMGNVGLLGFDDDEFTEKQKSYIFNIETSCNRAANLVKQFQTLSTGAISERVRVDLYEISSEVFNLLEQTANRAILKQLDMEPGRYCVIASPVELKQVLLNLGTNSAEAIEERGTRQGDYIRISAKKYAPWSPDRTGLPGGDYIHILFEDSGRGMSEDVQRRVFNPFYSTKDMGSKKGQGLGLAMVYNIVTRHMNGFIDIESAPGKGTTFHIYVPEVKPQIESDEEVNDIVSGDETILIIEDEEVVRDMATEILQKHGYKVIGAADGRKGIDVFSEKKDRIDLVILDLRMPVMSGRTCFGTIKGLKKDIRVLLTTSQNPAAAEEGVLAKANGVIFKPYNGWDLLIKLREILDS